MPENKTKEILELIEIMTRKQIEEIAPQQVIDFIDIIGTENAVKLCIEYPGLQFKVPIGKLHGKTSKNLFLLLGEESATAFMHHYGGEHITIPSFKKLHASLRNSRIIYARDKGLTVKELSLDFGLTARMINNICSTVPVFTAIQLEHLEILDSGLA